jgi:hypothetical protein
LILTKRSRVRHYKYASTQSVASLLVGQQKIAPGFFHGAISMSF